jgi:hypothetical protein
VAAWVSIHFGILSSKKSQIVYSLKLEKKESADLMAAGSHMTPAAIWSVTKPCNIGLLFIHRYLNNQVSMT